MNIFRRFFHRPFIIRLFNWEYWPFGVVYTLIFPVWIILGIRARSFFFFNASNPSIENGGLLNESKKDIHAILPDHLYPRSLHFPVSSNGDLVLQAVRDAGMIYPVFGKPDVGGKGKGVQKILNDNELLDYCKKAVIDFHIQEMVPFDKEVGIFWYRYPGEKEGRISGIVRKEFLTVTGNGRDSIRTLLLNDKRGIMYAENISKVLGDEVNHILPAGEQKVVSPYGNHARGSMFLDDTHLADEQLNLTMNQIARQIPDFYFGRLDVKFRDWDSLKAGRDFKIIEVNGAGSEPTHIYDPGHSLFFAWKEIIRHMWVMNTISIMNHSRGVAYLSFSEGVSMYRKYKRLSKVLSAMPS